MEKQLSFNQATIRIMFVSCQVHIEFTEGENKIQVEGPPEEVDEAVKALQDFVRDLVRGWFTRAAISSNSTPWAVDIPS